MQREILFKAKRKDNGEWAEGNLVYVEKENSYNIMPFNTDTYCYDHFYERIESDFTLIEVIPETISQYTGLTDKNGVKIFENDITRYREHTDDGYIDKFDIVEFKNGAFVISNDWGCETLGDILESNELDEDVDYEIIGNKFDEGGNNANTTN